MTARLKALPVLTRSTDAPLFPGWGKDAEQDKAERIADYLYAYSKQGAASARPGLRPQTGSTLGLQPKASPEINSAKGKRTIIIDHSAEDRLQAKLRQAAKEINALETDIYQGKSDKLELKRDLHTYEYQAGHTVDLTKRLTEIANTTETLPGFITVAEAISTQARGLFLGIQCQLEDFAKPEERVQREVLTRPLGLQLRMADTSHHLRTVYRGAGKVSGQTCILHIMANKALMDLRVIALTPEQNSLTFQLKQKAVSEVDTLKYLKSYILPFLYVRWNKLGELDLALDRDVGHRLGSLFLQVQGSRRKILLHMKEDGMEVSFSSSHTEASLLVSIDKITANSSIFSHPYEELKAILEEKLLILHNPERLVWVQEGAQGVTFKAKEKGSKLLDPDYLSERLHDFVQVLVAKEELTVDGHWYVIELYAHKTVEKLRITGRDHYEEIGADSQLMKLVKGLQFELLQKSIKTLLCSLELEVVVKALFAPKPSLTHSSSMFVNSTR
jgi:hypothetical protein